MPDNHYNLQQISPPFRRLSETESFYVTYKVAILVTCTIHGPLTEEMLQAALLQVAKRHPLLKCRIIGVDNAFYFDKALQEVLPLKVINNIEKQEQIHQHIVKELNTPLAEDKTLFRAVLLSARGKDEVHTLITTVHHAIADGISAIQLQQDILQACADHMQNILSDQVARLAIMPPLEAHIPKNITKQDLENYIQNYINRAALLQPRALPCSPVDDKTQTKVNFLQINLSPQQTKSLINQCRSHNTTVHGALCAAHLIAIRKMIDDGESALTLCCHSPIDVRSRLQPPIDKNQLFSAAIGCGTCHAVKPTTSLWQLAKAVSDEIRDHIENDDLFKGLLTFKDTRAKFKLATAIGITNVGRINLAKTYSSLTLKQVIFMPAHTIPMVAATVITFDDQLVINYPYLDPYYSAAVIERMAKLAMNLLSLS